MKFLLHTQIGIEKITELELEQKFKGQYSLDYSGYVPHKNGIVQIDWKNEDNLFFFDELQTIEDAFMIIDYVPDINQDFTLKQIYQKLDKQKIKSNLDYFFDKLNRFGSGNEFRFVTRKKAGNDFRRIDLENSIQDFFKKNNARARVTDKEGVKEVWSTLVKNRLIISIRLTDKEKRHSTYKTVQVQGTLRPSVAYSMAFLAEIKSKNTVWDPFCGAGTIGAEILENFKFKKLMLGDRAPDAVEATRTNLANLKSYDINKGKVSIRLEDFYNSKNFSDVLISNLPFGNIYEINESFIKDFFEKVTATKEVEKLVILFPEILESENWQMTRKFAIQVLGFPAYILVYQRRK